MNREGPNLNVSFGDALEQAASCCRTDGASSWDERAHEELPSPGRAASVGDGEAG